MQNDDLISAVKQFIRTFQANGEVKILKYHMRDRFEGQNNYKRSSVIRLDFRFREFKDTKASTAILKIPSLDPQYEYFKTDNIYNREVLFYEKVLPTMYQVDNFEPFAPILCATSQGSAIILEDLAGDGYKNYDLAEQFDLDHSRAALNVLAVYHGLGYKYLQNSNKDDPSMSLIRPFQPTIMVPLERNDFDRFCKWVEPFVSISLFQKILNLGNEVVANPTTPGLPHKDSMAVIIHGDLLPGNILFKYDNNDKVCKAKLIDWDFAREASPILDLIDFFTIDVSIETFEENGEDLLNFYVATLNHVLSFIVAKRKYSRAELDTDMAYYINYFFRKLLLLCKFGEKFTYTEPSGEETNPYVYVLLRWLDYFEKKQLI